MFRWGGGGEEPQTVYMQLETKTVILLHISIASLTSKRCIAELPLRAGLIVCTS